MFYNNLKTHVLEPNSHSNKRTEFKVRLQDVLLTTDWRLLDVGMQLLRAPAEGELGFPNSLLGNSAPIKNIYLYDANVELSKMTEFKDLVAFMNRNRSNDASINLKNLDGVSLGFSVFTDIDTTLQSTGLFFPNTNSILSTDESLTPRAHLSLQTYLPLLKNLTFLHTSIFQDLRLVVEYDYKNVGTLTDIPSQCTRPKLVFEQVMNDEVANTFLRDFFKNPIVWNEMESERFILQSTTPTANVQTQRTNLRSTGFLNKTLGRVLIQKRAKGTDNLLYRKQYSLRLFNEVLQMRVNGSDLIPEAIKTSQYNMGLLCDTWGSLNTTESSNVVGILDQDNAVALVSNTANYTGFTVGKKISDLQLDISRDFKSTYDASLNDQIEVILYGEVLKTIIPDKFVGYQVVYL
jgi:hypothetical protein